MTKLVRLVYTSHALFESNTDSAHMEPQIERILVQSRVNNKKANIGGVLYFADGYFFQCLEGKESAVLGLVEKLELDQRHENLKISYFKHVKKRCFKDWSMKYVPVGQDVADLMKARGYGTFSPCDFDEADINALIDMFTRLEDTSLKNEKLRKSCKLDLHWWQRLLRPLELQR